MGNINSWNNQVTNAYNQIILNSGSNGVAIATDNANGAVTIGTGTVARLINIGQSAAAHVINIGVNNGASSLGLNAGTGDMRLISGDEITLDAAGVLELNSTGAAIGIGNDANNFAVNVGTAGVRTVTLGSNSGASNTTVQAGSAGITLTGAVTSANAISITSGNISLVSGNVSITSGSVILPATTATVGIIYIGGYPFAHAYGTRNSSAGFNAANLTMTGYDNSSFGSGAGNNISSGYYNTLVGSSAGLSISTGQNNTIIGAQAAILTTGSGNLIIGSGSAGSLTTGSSNLIFGGGSAYTSESSNILLNHTGVITDANTIRIGTSGGGVGQQNKCFIAGIRGITTANADAIAVLVDSAGQLGTVSSSLRYKENIVDMSSYSDDLHQLRPVVFNYKNHSIESKSVGLIAEEVSKIMPHLVVNNKEGLVETVKYHDLVPMLLNEIQKLRKDVDELKKVQGL